MNDFKIYTCIPIILGHTTTRIRNTFINICLNNVPFNGLFILVLTTKAQHQ